MGQRHQLFAMARIDGRYRGLAALHNQWHFGSIALRQWCDENFWSSKSGDPFATADTISPESYGERVAPFPFITTYLVLGTSFDPADGYQARVHPLDFNMDLFSRQTRAGSTIPEW